jgi:hypothetical protein
MMQITADLYSIFLALYIQKNDGSYDEGVVARGSFNARHCFLRLGNNLIYAPLMTYLDGKDRAPDLNYHLFPIDWKSAPNAEGGPENGNKNNDLFHPYRMDFVDTGVPEALTPRTVIPVPTDEQLERVAWQKQQLVRAAARLGVPYPTGSDYATLDPDLFLALKKAFRARHQAFWDKARLDWERNQAVLDRQWLKDQKAEARGRK